VTSIDVIVAAGAESAPAGGAETAQVIGATAAAIVLVVALGIVGLGHRSGRVPALGRLAALSTRLSGLPGWAALPSGIAAVSLVGAAFGLYWDVSLHIDDGRDPGPLANPSHYFILAGLFGIFTAGWLAMVLADERPGPAAVRLAPGWNVPVGGVVMIACASFALAGFPLDDVFHRLFGQDVTLWGPTHLMMLGGAATSLLGILTLLVEGRLAARGAGGGGGGLLASRRARAIRLVFACGGLLAGLSIFQGEFDFGVPQFRLLFHPVLIALSASVPLVMARVIAGPGAALGSVAFFLALRGGLALVVGPVLGETTPHFPLYIAEAVLIEAAALAVSPRRPYRFGIAAGALAGSAGVLAEWGWSHVWMPIPWPAHVVPEAVALALPVAVAGGVLGAFAGGALRLRPDVAATRTAFAAGAASLLVIAGVLAYLGQTRVPDATRVAVTLSEAQPGPEQTVHATARFTPPDAARDADWLTTISWQGHDRLIVEPLRRVSDGVYRTTVPVPVHGTWKTGIRLHRDDVLTMVPLYLPADPAIPAAAVPAPARFERALVADREVLQRERKPGASDALWAAGGGVVLAGAALLLLLIGWALARIARCAPGRGEAGAPPRHPRRAPAGAPARPAARV
jgi:hypothetical protein